MNKLIEDGIITKEERIAFITNTQIDKVPNSLIGDIIGFAETVCQLERAVEIEFTTDYNRDVELADLFRISLREYLKRDNPYSYTEWLKQWLCELQQKMKAPKMAIETCPHCGHEIQMNLDAKAKEIPFCPYCGAQHIWLCSECIKIDDCNPCGKNSFCKGKCNI